MIDHSHANETNFELGRCTVVEPSGPKSEAKIPVLLPDANTAGFQKGRSRLEHSEPGYESIDTQNCLESVEDLVAIARSGEQPEVQVVLVDSIELHSKSFRHALNSHLSFAIASSPIAIGILWFASYPQMMMSIAGYLVGTILTYLIAMHGYCSAPTPKDC